MAVLCHDDAAATMTAPGDAATLVIRCAFERCAALYDAEMMAHADTLSVYACRRSAFRCDIFCVDNDAI